MHVLNVADGCMPANRATGSAAEIEEERRLLDVAMTRARDELNLWVPQRFHVAQQRAWGDRHLDALRSRYLPPESLLHFEQGVPAAQAAPQAASDSGQAEAQFDLGAALRGSWPSSEGSHKAPGAADPGQNPG